MMRNVYLSFIGMLCILMTSNLSAQIKIPKFGKGINIVAQDSSFTMKIGFRFQTLFQNSWDLEDDQFSNLTDHNSSFFIRRSRLKFDGWVLSPKLKYKAELSLSNRDNGGGNSARFSNAANIILDAAVEWNFYKNMSLWAGQGKLPGNRERIISSGNLQFVDRSRLNSRYTLDRDAGIMLKNFTRFGEDFILNQTIAITSGEGKNITANNLGGYGYTAKLEALPFGNFQSKGHYVGSDIKREPSPKLAVAVAYDINVRAGRERGQKGSFLVDSSSDAIGKDISSIFADLMYKHNGLSVMAEYVKRSTSDGPDVFVDGIDDAIGTYYTGTGTNIAVGQMMGDHSEFAIRWTSIHPDEGVANSENQYTLGYSQYVVGHKLKVQTDITYRAIDNSDDGLFYRVQMDVHF